jgi:hypothetical protein
MSFSKLFGSHVYHALQGSELRNLFLGPLHDFGDDVAVTLNRYALTVLNGRQKLSQPVLRFCNAHRHTHILAIL